MIHRVKGATGPQPAIVYYHGGGGVSGTPATMAHFVNSYCVDGQVTCVNAHYRVAPENKCPAGINDGYAALKWTLANAEALNIDPKRVAITGDSGGGWICAAVAMMLAERDESHLVKFHMPSIP